MIGELDLIKNVAQYIFWTFWTFYVLVRRYPKIGKSDLGETSNDIVVLVKIYYAHQS